MPFISRQAFTLTSFSGFRNKEKPVKELQKILLSFWLRVQFLSEAHTDPPVEVGPSLPACSLWLLAVLHSTHHPVYLPVLSCTPEQSWWT